MWGMSDLRLPIGAYHVWYTRQPQDLPCIGQNVRLQLTVRRFVCPNPHCPKKTFPDWLPAYGRHTQQLTQVMRQVGFEVSAESARRIFRCFQIITSGDTVLRIVKQTALKERCVAAFDIWLDSADLNPLKTVRNFSKSLRDEYSFIRAALESDKCMAAPALNSCA